MVQSIGQASGVVAAGAAFVIPALYINRAAARWWHIFLACTIGGFLGVALIIPLRSLLRAATCTATLPFPEATAIQRDHRLGESGRARIGKICSSPSGWAPCTTS